MRHAIALLLLVVACERDHTVRVLLGPTADTVTAGFRCVEDANPNRPLFARALVGTDIQFNLVIDAISFGRTFPGCRGEEILRTCSGDECSIPEHTDGSKRFCLPIRFPASILGNEPLLVTAIRDQLAGQIVLDDAPDGPVALRAVATTQPCDQIDQASDGAYPALDGARAVGCAYSCPLVLDDARGPIAMSFDTLTNRCEEGVRVCAAFPGR